MAHELKLPRYVKAYRRRLKWFHYFRRRGFAPVRIPGEPWSVEFMNAYADALAGATPLQVGAGLAPAGSTEAAIRAYLASPNFDAIDSDETKRVHRRVLERFATSKWAPLPFHRLDRIGVERVLAEMKETPGAAQFRNVLRRFCKWAVAEKLLKVDPTEGVKVKMPRSDGWHTMNDAEREQYKARHPVGTKARAAYAILHFTALRVSDARKLSSLHIRPFPGSNLGVLHLKQQKTGEPVTQDVEAEMMEAIDACPKPAPRAGEPRHLNFLLNKDGRPYSAKGLSNAVKDWCVEAGLSHCSAHSFRKGTLTRIADRGGTPHQIAARGGHRGTRMAETYTRKANQLALDRDAARLLRDEPETKVSNVEVLVDRKAK
jgi:integrase